MKKSLHFIFLIGVCAFLLQCVKKEAENNSSSPQDKFQGATVQAFQSPTPQEAFEKNMEATEGLTPQQKDIGKQVFLLGLQEEFKQLPPALKASVVALVVIGGTGAAVFGAPKILASIQKAQKEDLKGANKFYEAALAILKKAPRFQFPYAFSRNAQGKLVYPLEFGKNIFLEIKMSRSDYSKMSTIALDGGEEAYKMLNRTPWDQYEVLEIAEKSGKMWSQVRTETVGGTNLHVVDFVFANVDPKANPKAKYPYFTDPFGRYTFTTGAFVLPPDVDPSQLPQGWDESLRKYLLTLVQKMEENPKGNYVDKNMLEKQNRLIELAKGIGKVFDFN